MNVLRRIIYAASATILSVTSLVALSPAAHAAFPGSNGLIVYAVSSGSGDVALKTAKPDGTNETDLSQQGNDPMFSPDSSQIAFVKVDSNNAIWVMDKDGSNAEEVYAPSGNDAVIDLTWSPDGSRIAFELVHDFFDEDVTDKNSDIYIVNADGSGAAAVTGADEADINEADPYWDPSGESSNIVFRRTDADTDSGNGQIYTIDAEGGTAALVKATTGKDLANPQYSPDGGTIAYNQVESRDGEGDATEAYIYTMTSAGASAAQLTDASTGVEWDPAFSPDGTKIVYHLGTAGGLDGSASQGELYVVDSDGSNETSLGIDQVEEPDWGSPIDIVVEPKCTTDVGKKCTDFTPDVPEVCQVAGLKPDSGAFGKTVTSGGFGYQPNDKSAGTQEFSYSTTDDDTLDTYTCNFTVTFIPASPDTGEAPKGNTGLIAGISLATVAGGYTILKKRKLLKR